MAIDRRIVEHVSRLARLRLTDPEIELYRKQLGAILDYIAKLQELDLAGVEPLSHPDERANVFRPDQSRPGVPREEALKNAPDRSNDFFIVPKVVE